LAKLFAEEFIVVAPVPKFHYVLLMHFSNVSAQFVTSFDRGPANRAPLTAYGSFRKNMFVVGSTLDWVDAELEVFFHQLLR
jgi:hypothetical protein